MSVYPNTGCHAVLALLSEGYPPLEGRSPTRYSPVCHSTHGLLHFRVRLACVRHAASVDSEPGSNSHVNFAALRLGRLRSLAQGQLVNARPIWLLRCSIRFILGGSSPVAFARTANSGRPISQRHPLTLCLPPHRLLSLAMQRLTGCVCLHALSSFQRTDRWCAK